MFERFTDQARRIVVLAQEEARTLNHGHIGTEHILLALIREGTGQAAIALGSLGVTEDAVRQRVEEIAGRGQQDAPRGHIPFTPRGKETLQLSMREAIALGDRFISTEHILLALIRESEGVGIRVLTGMGVDPDRVRQQVIRLVSARRGEAKAGVPSVAAKGGQRKKRKQLAEVLDRLSSIEWRLSVLEHRVGTGPDVRDIDRQAAREQEWAALPSLTEEVDQLRDLLRRHGIDSQDGAA